MHAVMQTKRTSETTERHEISPKASVETPLRAESSRPHVEDDRPLDDDLYGNLAHTD
jgi:hypothetical protein